MLRPSLEAMFFGGVRMKTFAMTWVGMIALEAAVTIWRNDHWTMYCMMDISTFFIIYPIFMKYGQFLPGSHGSWAAITADPGLDPGTSGSSATVEDMDRNDRNVSKKNWHWSCKMWILYEPCWVSMLSPFFYHDFMENIWSSYDFTTEKKLWGNAWRMPLRRQRDTWRQRRWVFEARKLGYGATDFSRKSSPELHWNLVLKDI